MVQKKKCTRCGKVKALEQFKLNATGLSNRCKLCKKKQGEDPYRFLKLKLPAQIYKSIENKAQVSGYSVINYLIYLHEINMQKNKDFY